MISNCDEQWLHCFVSTIFSDLIFLSALVFLSPLLQLKKAIISIAVENIMIFFIITTSNAKPDDLYLGGLQRDQFLPYIENIKANTLVYSLNSGKDYRELYLNKQNRFFIVKDPQTKKNFNQVLFNVLSGKQFATKEIEIKGRKLIIDNYVSGIAKFDFKDLCFQTYGSEDYIEICKITKIFFIENIPNFTDELINEQYRFINLIDIIYDNQLSLVATATVPINQLTSSVKLQKVFQRTLSRLNELTRSN